MYLWFWVEHKCHELTVRIQTALSAVTDLENAKVTPNAFKNRSEDPDTLASGCIHTTSKVLKNEILFLNTKQNKQMTKMWKIHIWHVPRGKCVFSKREDCTQFVISWGGPVIPYAPPRRAHGLPRHGISPSAPCSFDLFKTLCDLEKDPSSVTDKPCWFK